MGIEQDKTHEDLIKDNAKIISEMEQIDLDEVTKILKTVIDAYQLSDDEIENIVDKLSKVNYTN